MKHNIQKILNEKFILIILNIYIFLLIIIPKEISTVFSIIPIRLLLSCFIVFIYISDRILNPKNYKPINMWLFGIYMLFLIATIPSLFITKNLVVSLYTITKFLTAFIIFEICYSRKFEKEDYKKLLFTFLISIIVVILYGFLQYIFNFGLQNVGIDKYTPAKGRTVSTFFNTIYFGIFLNLIIPYLIWLNSKVKEKKYKFIVSILIILAFLAIILTFTRSAFLIVVGMLGIILVLNYKMIFNLFMLGTIAICISLIFIIPGADKLAKNAYNDGISLLTRIDVLEKFLPALNEDMNNNPLPNVDITPKDPEEVIDKPDEVIDKPDEVIDKPDENTPNNPKPGEDNTDFDDASLEHRKDFAEISNRIANDNKYTGVGFGAYIDYMNSSEFSLKYSDYTGDKTHPHSSLVLLFSEVGIISQILFIVFYVSLIIRTFVNVINYRKDNNKINFSTANFAVIIGFAVVNIISENAVYDSQVYYLFMIIIGLSFNYLSQVSGSKKKVVFISSTGGHLNELSQLKPMFKKYDYHIITEKTKSTLYLKNMYNKKIDYLIYGTKDKGWIYPFKFLLNCFKSLFIYLKCNPDYIITTGTHTAVPMCYIGKLFGSKVIFIETFANIETKTLSGRMIYPIADLFIVQWKEMQKHYEKSVYGGWIY